MNRLILHHILFALFFIIMLLSPVALAQKIICPVCGQEFSENHKICPNDGTDLTLVGQVDEFEDDELGDVSKDIENTKSKTHKAQKNTDDNKTESDEYNRQDRGGDRIRSDDEDGYEYEDADYNDRRRRVGNDKNKLNTLENKARKERYKKQKFRKKDKKLRQEFEKKRQKILQNRHDWVNADEMTKRKFDDIMKQYLWAQAAPFSSLGFRLSWMGDASSLGPVIGPEIELNLVKNRIRVGLSTSIGMRSLAKRGDLIFMESVAVGIQKPWKFSPYILLRSGIGAMLSTRFGVDVTYLIRSIGIESGADCRISQMFVITPSFGYVRSAINDVYWNSLTIKLSIGF